MNLDLQELKQIHNEEQNLTWTAQRYAQAHGIAYDDKFRRKVSYYMNKENAVSPDTPDSYFGNETSTETVQYSNDKQTNTSSMPSAWDLSLNRFLTPEEFCDKYGLDKNSVKSSKLISHVPGHMTYNLAMYSPEEESVLNIEEHLEEIVSKHIHPVSYSAPAEITSDIITNLTYSDSHVGMNPNSDSNSLYGGKWDAEELFNRLDIIVDYTVKISSLNASNTLYLRDLGDLADGMNGETVRGGHELPQNMSNVEVFDTALRFKMEMVDKLVAAGQYKDIICENICNSNHGGDFDYFINSAFKQIAEAKYTHVKVNNHRKFISHYCIGNHCFIISHGKDSHTLKFGFKPILDNKAMEKIDNYIKGNNLYSQYKYFTFIKGDSHLMLFDMSTSQDFNYFNYPALSPSSQWVQNNFKQGFSGFVVETFHPQQEEINIHYKKFEWKK